MLTDTFWLQNALRDHARMRLIVGHDNQGDCFYDSASLLKFQKNITASRHLEGTDVACCYKRYQQQIKEGKALFSLWGFGGLYWKALGKRVISEIQSDDIFGRAAQLAYYFLLALFPLLLFLTSVIGILLGSDTGLRHALFGYLGRVLPGSAFNLVDSTMYEVSAASGGGKLTFGILAALWAASNGMGAITEALNAAYNVKESRAWWKQRLTAIGLTVVLSILIISALVLVLYGGKSPSVRGYLWFR